MTETIDFQFASAGPTLRIVVLVCLLVFALLALALVVVLAALPGRIAKARSHPQVQAVNICGWVGLPTGILWAIALVWAFWRSEPVGNDLANASGDLQKLEEQIALLERQIQNLDKIS